MIGMNETYYSPDQIAAMLGMHVKTVQRYIREGKLKARKVGKGWRVTGHDLSVFAEGAGAGRPRAAVTASAVIDIADCSRNAYDRIESMLGALLAGKGQDAARSSFSAQYMPDEARMRIMAWGSGELAEMILSAVNTLTKG